MQSPIVTVLGVFLLIIALSSSVSAQTASLLWFDSKKERLVAFHEDTGEKIIQTRVPGASDLALDRVTGSLFWTDLQTSEIFRGLLTSAEVGPLPLTRGETPLGVALDERTSQLFVSYPRSREIVIFQLDTGGSRVLDLPVTLPLGVSADSAAGKLYVADGRNHSIIRSNLDGTGSEVVVADAGVPRSVVADSSAGYIFWTDVSSQAVMRASISGTGKIALVSGAESPRSIALDAGARRIFWTEAFSGKVLSTDYQGGDLRTLTDTALVPSGLGLHANYLVFTDLGSGLVQKRNWATGEITPVVEPMGQPSGIGFEGSTGKVYWGDLDSISILRSRIDGTEKEVFFNQIAAPASFDFDPSEQMVYWADPGSGKIQRSNEYKTIVEDIVTGLELPLNVKLDRSRTRLYWIDSAQGVLEQSAVTGADRSVLISGITGGRGLAYDATGNLLYWAQPGEGKISRIQTTGSGREDVLTGIAAPGALALDEQNQQLYWASLEQGEVYRYSLLTGENVLLHSSPGSTIEELAILTDQDGDGVDDRYDSCSANREKVTPGQCGCAVSDTDIDSDGVADCLDQCPQDPAKQNPGRCGCGIIDVVEPSSCDGVDSGSPNVAPTGGVRGDINATQNELLKLLRVRRVLRGNRLVRAQEVGQQLILLLESNVSLKAEVAAGSPKVSRLYRRTVTSLARFATKKGAVRFPVVKKIRRNLSRFNKAVVMKYVQV